MSKVKKKKAPVIMGTVMTHIAYLDGKVEALEERVTKLEGEAPKLGARGEKGERGAQGPQGERGPGLFGRGRG